MDPLCFDSVPPLSTFTATGNETGQYTDHYIGPVLLSVTATDNASGVAYTTITVDQGPFQTYSGPFYFYVPGAHCTGGYSVDVAGNTESYQSGCLVIDSNQQFALSVSKSGTGSGTVTSTDGGINCGSTCSSSYWDEEPVTLTATPAAGSVFAGWRNCDLSFGYSCTLTVVADRTATAIFNVPVALQFVPVTPCRVVDTRGPAGDFGGPPIQGGSSRDFAIPGGPCSGIPSAAAAYSLNVTAVPSGRLGYLTVWPTGLTRTQTSILNSLDGRIKANAAVVPAGDNAAVSVYASSTSDVLLDIDGYFTAPSDSTLAFYPLTPCRIADTRNPDGDLGGPFLTGNLERDFPLLQSPCIPQGISAQAYSLNITAVPHPDGQRLGYLTVWPKGQSQPTVSTLNNPTGTIVANGAIVPAGASGAIAVYPNNDTDLLIDINGYFAAPGHGRSVAVH